MKRAREIRVVRVATWPRHGREGIGRSSYELTLRLPYPTLYITRAEKEAALDAPAHVSLLQIPVRDCALPSTGGSTWRVMPALAAKAALNVAFLARSLGALIRFRPHVVHIHSLLPYSHAVVGRLLGARVFVTFHGTDLYRAGSWPGFPTMMRIFHRVYYVSRAMEPQLRGRVRDDRLAYTPNGVDTSTFRPSSAPRRPHLLTAGVLKWQKGIDVLIDAFAAIHSAHPEWRMRIAGDGPMRSSWQARAAAAGVQGKIDWLGRLSREQLIEEYGAASVFVLASLSEGFPKVILEAMACGAPVITTDVGSCREVVGVAGRVVPPGDAPALAAAMDSLMRDAPERERLSDHCVAVCSPYTWDEAARRVRMDIEVPKDSAWLRIQHS